MDVAGEASFGGVPDESSPPSATEEAGPDAGDGGADGSAVQQAAGAPVLVAVGYGARRVRSLDGRDWTDLQLLDQNGGDDNNLLRGVGYGDGRFVAVGGSSDCLIMTSDDGVVWENENRSASSWVGDVAYLDGTFIAAGGGGLRMRSTDGGVTWTHKTPYHPGHFRSVVAGNGVAVAVGHTANVGMASATRDGVTWTPLWQGGRRLWGSAYGNGVFVAMGYGGGIRSTDGQTWTEFSLEGSGDKVAFVNGEFVVAAGDRYFRSTDGESWTAMQVDTARNVAGYHEGYYFAFAWGSSSRILRSTNLSSWETVLEVPGSGFEQLQLGRVASP